MASGKLTEVDHVSLHHEHRAGDVDDHPKPSAEAESRGLRPPPIIAAMTHEYRAALERKLKRKVDLRLLPMIVIMYILNYIDRNNIAAARLAGLERDLKLDPNSSQFQTAVSILFVGYLLMQVPSNLFLNKIGKPALYLPTCMVVWGVISAATAACRNYAGLLAIRFLLGFVEAAYFPGCLYYLSCWYTREELGLRTTVLYTGSLISGAFSGLISAGITGNMDGARGLGAWQWLFLIEGVVTVAVAFGAYFVLPNFPRTTSWLDEEETALAVWRLQQDIGEDDWTSSGEQTFWHGFKTALEDVKTWILVCMSISRSLSSLMYTVPRHPFEARLTTDKLVLVFSIVASGSITNFFPTVVQTLGYSPVVSLLLTCPPYVLCVITTCLNAWHADRTGERYLHIVLPLCVAMAAFILGAATHTTAPRYVSMMLMVPGIYTGYTTALAWISNSLPRPPAKRAAALAFINAVSNCSSIYASYLYPKSDGPQYTAAFVHNCVACFVAVCAATVLRTVLVRLNRRLERGEFVEGAINAAPGEAAAHGFRFKV
ncbi:Pantothenate transporter liz1 [Colletotrichum higginsianum IMI 349063]|uniref:Pantothenate transporter liz1 n=1 Tax=Colletotrichum higginsianum (strain IMI 349063) TaxID=759273 RepID=A0A1B7Y5Q7_COLHI|nr:Pantothenate transporter liz1 [Colletotrichum higginsianum IMI 349063]OBR07347.1 Pantothenate transporter liz1 [Colletotrichum higginsianum IMI 349063]